MDRAGDAYRQMRLQNERRPLTVDDQYVYWTTWIDGSHGSLMRLAKSPAAP